MALAFEVQGRCVQSRRDCISQPRVARDELPWVRQTTTSSTLKGLQRARPSFLWKDPFLRSAGVQIIALLLCSAPRVSLAAEPATPLQALLITGGCCHDYSRQKLILSEGVSARANVKWTLVQEGGNGTRRQNIQQSIYQNPDWA